MCQVVNKYKSDYDVDIQRGTIWGNPFSDSDRAHNIARYKPYIIKKIKSGDITIEMLKSLRGKRLGCTCHPLPCHGDIIVAIVNKLTKQRDLSELC